MRTMIGAVSGFAIAMVLAGPAAAWGNDGHQVVGLIAYDLLTPKARRAADALLASDTDTLTAKDFASRATWADAYRSSHRETAEWHFADVLVHAPA